MGKVLFYLLFDMKIANNRKEQNPLKLVCFKASIKKQLQPEKDY